MVTKYYAKPILENRFWILEEDGRKLGTICRQEGEPFSHEQLLALLESAKKGISEIVAAQKASLAN